MNEVTIEVILSTLQEWVANKRNVDAKLWVEKAQELNIFLFDEYDKLAEAQQKVAALKIMSLDAQEKKNVSEATLRVEASDEYKEMRKLENKIKNVEEMIRIAKLQGRLREFG